MRIPAESAPPWAPGYGHRTAGVPGVEFGFRVELDDFEVEELPAYEPGGEGEHLYLWIEKRGVGTPDALHRLARALGARESDCGYAGRKDARARTRQWVSLAVGAPASEALALELEGITVLRAERHSNKLRLGHHRGNRFTLRLRGIDPGRRADVERVLDALLAHGLPNYFGSQRFGRTGHAAELGRRLVEGDGDGYIRALVHPDHAGEGGAAAELARVIEAGERGAYRGLNRLAGALDPDLAALARQLARRPGSLNSAVRAVPKATRRFHVNALQSLAFNAVLGRRLALSGDLALLQGDLAQKHDSLGCFHVEDLAVESARAERLEISPTGPLPGPKMDAPLGPAGELESEVLGQLGLDSRSFGGLAGGIGARGARRALRVPLNGLSREWSAQDLILGFELPKGSYATALVEELAKRWGGISR